MQPQKKSNYVNVNLRILKGIFANPTIPVVCPKKWAETVGIVSGEESGNLILLNISILESVFTNENFPIPVSRKWLETLHITIEVEAKPIVVDEAKFSITPAVDFEIPNVKTEEAAKTEEIAKVEEEKEEEECSAIVFGGSDYPEEEDEEEDEEPYEEPEEPKQEPKTGYSDWSEKY